MPRSSLRSAALAVALTQFAIAVCVPRAAHSHPSAEARLQAIDRQLGEAPSATLYVEHGKANLQAGRWQEALADAERALALEPTLRAALLLRAETRYASGEVDQALRAVDAVLESDPADAAAHHLRARVLREVGRLAEAATEYDRFLNCVRQPLPDHYIERADVHAAQGRLDAALAGLDEGMARLGMVATLQLAAVDLELRRGNSAAAVERLDRLLERTPTQVFWMVRRAEVLAAAGRHEDARQAFEAARAALPPTTRATALRELRTRIKAGLQHQALEPPSPQAHVDIKAQPAARPVEVVQKDGK